MFTYLNMRLLHSIHPKFIIFNVFCTLFAYNFPRYIHVKNNPRDPSLRGLWYQNHLVYLKNISTISFFITLLYLGQLTASQYIMLFVIAVISILYVSPSRHLKSLRSVPFAKPFVIALCWAALTLLIPCLYRAHIARIESWFLWKLFSSQFIIIFVTAILFDIRDINEDRKEGIKTIANQFSLRNVKFICYGLIYIRILFCIDHNHIGVELLFSILLTFLVYLTNMKRSDNFYIVVIDGSLVLYPTMMLFL